MPIGLMALAFAAYVSLGLPDGLQGVAWPSIRRDFSLGHDSFGALMIAFTAGYLASSFFGGRLMARFRLGALLTASTLSAALALLGYSAAPVWGFVVAAAVAAGLGGGGIDVTLNSYVASRHGDALMQWLHASYGIGATLGPVIMTAALGRTGSWRPGYLMVGLLELALAAAFLLTGSMWEHRGAAVPPRRSAPARGRHGTMRAALRSPKVWLSVSLFFLYMGIEVAFGAWSYTLLAESRGVRTQLAGYWVGSFWGIFTAGRIAAGFYTARIGRLRLVPGASRQRWPPPWSWPWTWAMPPASPPSPSSGWRSPRSCRRCCPVPPTGWARRWRPIQSACRSRRWGPGGRSSPPSAEFSPGACRSRRSPPS